MSALLRTCMGVFCLPVEGGRLFRLVAVYGISAFALCPAVSAQKGKMTLSMAPEQITRGVSLTVFSPESGEVRASLHIGKLFIENERRHFMRIGVFRQMVAQDVSIELHTGILETEDLARISDVLARISESYPLQIRALSISERGGQQWLQAELVQLAGDRWKILGEAWVLNDGQVETIPEGSILRIRGSGQGTWEWITGGPDGHKAGARASPAKSQG